MTFRTDTWRQSTSLVGQGVNTYQQIKYQNHSCGSTASEMIGTFLNLGMGIAQTAVTQKAGSTQTTGQKQGATLNSLTSGTTQLSAEFEALNQTYQDSLSKLNQLKQQKQDAADKTKIKTLSDEITNTKSAEDNQEKIAQYTKLSSQITSLGDIKGKIEAQEAKISENKATAEMQIDTTLSNSHIKITADGTAAAQVTNSKDDYGTGENFNQAMYNSDIAKAQQMDTQFHQKQKAQIAIETAQKTINELKLPEGLTAPNPLTSQSIQSIIADLTNQRDALGNEDLATGGTINQLNDKEKSLTKMQKNSSQEGQAKLEKDIAAQQKIVDGNKQKLVAKKKALTEEKTKLMTAKSNIEKVVTEQQEANGAKANYDKIKSNNNKDRNFFQKMFGSGKSQLRKDSKKFYKEQKAEYKEAQSQFSQSYSFSANQASLAAINGQLANINNMIATIEQIESES